MAPLWDRIRRLEGHTLATTKQGKPFKVLAVGENHLKIVPSASGKAHPIQRLAFEEAERHRLATATVIPSQIAALNPAWQHSSYVAAIFRAVVSQTSTVHGY